MQLSTIITVIVIFVFFVVGVLSIVTLLTNEESLRYTLINTVKYPYESPVFTKRKSIELPGAIANREFDMELAHGCAQLIENIYANGMDVEGVVVQKRIDYNRADDKPFVYVLTKGNVIYVVIRGTNLVMTEWLNNLKVDQQGYDGARKMYDNTPTFMRTDPNIMIHNGFLAVYDRVAPQLLKTIEHLMTLNKDYSICLTGHSMGGSVSAIIGAELEFRGYNNILIYVFGTPRTGNPTFTKYIEQVVELEMYAIMNTEDNVAQTILAVSPNGKQNDSPFYYSFCGNDIYFSNNWYSMYYNHSIMIYVDAVKKIE